MAGSSGRTGFRSIGGGGLNWDSFPLRLFTKGNAKFWDPSGIDFTRDAEDWKSLSDEAQERILRLCAQFAAGEEAVTEDIQPFVRAMAAEGRLGDEMYLTQFAFEEAKHVQAFRLWLDALGVTHDLHAHVDRNDIEGALALTGYYAWNHICTARGIFPGMREIIRRIGDDERRHMAWGTFTCRRHVAADDTLWPVVTGRLDELLPHLKATVERDDQPMADDEDQRYQLPQGELLEYATDRALRRLGAIETARGVPVARIDLDASPEELEERFGEEDRRAMSRLE